MMFIPAPVLALLTFPGIILHELAHQLFCRWTGTKVLDVRYFQLGNPAGYVLHERATTNWRANLISLGPFLLNSLFAMIIGFPAALRMFQFDSAARPIDYILMWLAVCVAMHSIPSTDAAENLWQQTFRKRGFSLAKFFVVPLVAFIHLLAFGSFFMADIVYGICITLIPPNVLVHILS